MYVCASVEGHWSRDRGDTSFNNIERLDLEVDRLCPDLRKLP